MAEINHVLFNYIQDGKTSNIIPYACYSGPFYNSKWKIGKKCYFQTCFRLTSQNLKAQSEWWLNEFLFSITPDRAIKAIKIDTLPPDKYATYVKQYNGKKDPADYGYTYYAGDGWYPWIEVKIDIDKIIVEDAYIFVTLLRYVQENQHLVERAYQVSQKHPELTAEECAIACMASSEDFRLWHTLISWPQFGYSDEAWRNNVRTYSFKKRWANILEIKPELNKPWRDQIRKCEVSDFFEVEEYRYGPRAQPRTVEEVIEEILKGKNANN